MKRSGWLLLPAAFFLLVNFLKSNVKSLFFLEYIYLLFLISLFFFLRKLDLKRIFCPIVVGVSSIIFIYGIIQKFILFPVYLKKIDINSSFYSQAIIARIKSGRIFSIFTLPTLYAIICVILILFILHYLLKSKKNKIYWMLLIFLGLLNLGLTQSIGGILYLSVGVLIYLFLSGILNFKYLAPVIMILSLFFFIIIALRFSEVKKLEPAKLRFSNWKQAVRIIKTNPFWGIGLGNYQSEVAYFTYQGEARSIYAHNFILQIIAETGIIIPFFLLLIFFFSRKKLEVVNSKEKVLYISILWILFFYNFVDIGCYFFSAGIMFPIVLSQIYPKYDRKFSYNSVILSLLLIILLIGDISDSYQKKAVFLLVMKDYNQAEKYYRKSFRVNPFNFRAIAGFAYINFLKNNILEAEKYLNKSLKIYQYSAFINYLKSKIEFRKKHFFYSFYYASIANEKDRLNNQYKRWYEYIKNNLQAGFVKSGN